MKPSDAISLRFRIFKIRVMLATETKPRRVSISDPRLKSHITIGYGDESNALDAAVVYLKKRGIPVDALGLADLDADAVILSTDFRTELRGALNDAPVPDGEHVVIVSMANGPESYASDDGKGTTKIPRDATRFPSKAAALAAGVRFSAFVNSPDFSFRAAPLTDARLKI